MGWFNHQLDICCSFHKPSILVGCPLVDAEWSDGRREEKWTSSHDEKSNGFPFGWGAKVSSIQQPFRHPAIPVHTLFFFADFRCFCSRSIMRFQNFQQDDILLRFKNTATFWPFMVATLGAFLRLPYKSGPTKTAASYRSAQPWKETNEYTATSWWHRDCRFVGSHVTGIFTY